MKNIYLSRATTLSPYLYCSSLPETGAPFDTNVCRNLLLLGFWVRFGANFGRVIVRTFFFLIVIAHSIYW